MAGTHQSRRATTFHDNLVVDVDVHISYREPELVEEIASRLDEPYSSELQGTYAYNLNGVERGTPGKHHKYTITDPVADIQKPLCEDFGVDYPIVNVLLPFGGIFKTDRAVQEMRAANDLVIERFLDEHENFRGLATVSALEDPEAMAEELDRVGDEDGIVGAIVFAGKSEKPLGDPRYDVFYQAAEDNDLTVAYHAGASTLKRGAPVLHHDLETYLSLHALSHPWAQMLTTTSLITQGVPEKFPDLTFVQLEAGIAWIPYMMARLNREYGQHRADAPLLEKSPEEYIRERFYFGTQPIGEFDDPTHMQPIIDVIGPDLLLFATDYPHLDFDHPNAMDRYLSQFTPEDRDKVLHQNAIDVFGLEL